MSFSGQGNKRQLLESLIDFLVETFRETDLPFVGKNYRKPRDLRCAEMSTFDYRSSSRNQTCCPRSRCDRLSIRI